MERIEANPQRLVTWLGWVAPATWICLGLAYAVA